MENTRAREVSRVSNELKFLNKDSYYSRRAILGILEDKVKFLLSQKLGERNSLYRENELFSHIPCLELEKIESVKCDIVEFRTCKTLMVTKEELPSTVDSKFFNNILNVTSIDGQQLFTPMSTRDYILNSKRRYAHLSPLKYYRRGNKLYIPDHEVYAINVDLLTLEVEKIKDISTCSKEECCKSYWDYPLVNSDKLAEYAVREVIQELAGTVITIPTDENPNKDSNQKSATIQ